MPDSDAIEELASLYVLGQLAPRERAEFEARLASSPALRAQVQEFENACEALALAAPARRPSTKAWEQIAARTTSTPALATPTTAVAPAPARSQESLAGRRRETPPRPATGGLVLAWREIFWRAGWAVAALVTLLWLLQEPHPAASPTRTARQSNPEPASNPEADPTRSRGHGLAAATRSDSGPVSFTSADANADAVAASPTRNASPSLTRDESRRLQMRVQELASQLADVNHALTQRLVLPPGAGRFQVFRLGATNGSSALSAPTEALASANPDATLMEELLARALARQLASATPPSANNASGSPSSSTSTSSSSSTASTTTTSTELAANTHPDPTAGGAGTGVDAGGTTSSTPISLAQQQPTTTPPVTFDVVELHPGSLLADTAAVAPPASLVANRSSVSTPSTEATSLAAASQSALGFYSPDTGRGSIALVTSTTLPEGLTYQVWATDAQGNASISLGTTGNSSGNLLLNFTLDPGLISSPAFMITVEPSGGSAAPLGPVVVRPPNSTTPSP